MQWYIIICLTTTRLDGQAAGHARSSIHRRPSRLQNMVVNVPALETAESSFDDTRETIRQRTGVRISKDQLEDKASEMAADSEPFYGSIDP